MFTVGSAPDTDPLNEQLAAHVEELFRTFGETGRVRLLAARAGREMNPGGLAGRLGVSESALSLHLRGLRQMHLVVSRRVGQEVFHRIESEHIAALLWQVVWRGMKGSAFSLRDHKSD